jgi:SAM-dependent methyltransferase
VSETSKMGYPHFPTLLFAIPFSGRPLPPQLTLAFHNCSPPMNYNTVMLNTYGAPIADARNMFCEKAIEIGAKYIFFWDEDVELPPQTLRELCFMMEHHPECGVIGGIYCLKVDRPEPLVFTGVGNGPCWDWKVGEVFECSALGMGCTMIRTDMLKDIPKPWFKSVDDCSPYLDNIRYGEQWTEDLYFCKKVVETETWKILAHGQLLPNHIDVKTGRSYSLPPDSKPMRPFGFKAGKLKIADIGCGPNKLKTDEGTVVGVDIRDLDGVDYRCDLRKLPFGTGEFDISFSSHVLEHFGRNETMDVLKEWTRILKPKGEFRIVVPNIGWAATQIEAGIIDHNVLNVLYGQQEYGENFHKMGFTPLTLSAMLEELGFGKQELRTEGYNIIIRAWRGKAPKKAKKKR